MLYKRLLVGVSVFSGESQESSHWVRARTEDKHKRGRLCHVIVEGLKGHIRALNKGWPKVLSHKVCDTKHSLLFLEYCMIEKERTRSKSRQIITIFFIIYFSVRL